MTERFAWRLLSHNVCTPAKKELPPLLQSGGLDHQRLPCSLRFRANIIPVLHRLRCSSQCWVADLSVKKFQVPALRAREWAMATAQAETVRFASRRLAALPRRLNRRSVVSLEARRYAAVEVCALACPLTFCLHPLSAFSPAEPLGSHLAARRKTSVRPGPSRYRTIGKRYLSDHQSNRTPRGQRSRKQL
jgi:hypothetical protein